MKDAARAVVQIRRAGGTAGPARLALLSAIREQGSISGAAKVMGLSYKGAWNAVQALNNLFERPLVEAQTGGQTGGAARVTASGEAVLAAYRAIDDELVHFIARLEHLLAAEADANLLWRLNLKTSARNTFRGTVAAVAEGAVNAEVMLDIGGGLALIAMVTRDSVADLELAPGRPAVALVKSSFVILVPGDDAIRTSARNRLAGTIVRHDVGAVNDEVVLDLGGGKTLTAVVTRESGAELALTVGNRAQGLIKASHVILAID